MLTDLFVYGTLQDPEVLGALLDDPPPLTPVVVEGWRVVPLEGRVYPALVPDAGSRAHGHHLRVDDRVLSVLDRFEGPAYDLRPVGWARVDGRQVQLHGWVLDEPHHVRRSPGSWTLASFLADPARAAWVQAIRRGHGAP